MLYAVNPKAEHRDQRRNLSTRVYCHNRKQGEGFGPGSRARWASPKEDLLGRSGTEAGHEQGLSISKETGVKQDAKYWAWQKGFDETNKTYDLAAWRCGGPACEAEEEDDYRQLPTPAHLNPLLQSSTPTNRKRDRMKEQGQRARRYDCLLTVVKD